MQVSESGQAGELTNEEITPAMLKAGVEAYWRQDVDDVGSAAIVRDIYRSMVAARINRRD